MPLPVPVLGVASFLAAVVDGGRAARSRLRPVRLLNDAVQRVVDTKDFQPVVIPHVSIGGSGRPETA